MSQDPPHSPWLDDVKSVWLNGARSNAAPVGVTGDFSGRSKYASPSLAALLLGALSLFLLICSLLVRSGTDKTHSASPAALALHSAPGIITLSKYNRIQVEQSYAQVVSIIGAPGKRIGYGQSDSNPTYIWEDMEEDDIVTRDNVVAWFSNDDRLAGKIQYGLK